MKKYLNDLKSIYKFKNLLIIGMIVSFFIILIDILNIPSNLYLKGYIALIILLILIIIIKWFDVNNIKMLFYKHINIIDKYLATVLFASVFASLYEFIFDIKKYKIILLLALFIFIIISYVIRIIKIDHKSKDEKNNVVDLEFIVNNKIELNDKKLLLLEEKEVDYDLLNRKSIINQLYNTIINCEPATNFTIGLNGKWGSGKTTIIKNVLRIMNDNDLLDNYVIVNFNPWKYDDEKVILKAFLNEILNNIQFSIDESTKETLIQDVINVVFDSKIASLGNLLNKEFKKLNTEPEISSVVNNYLLNNDKKMLIIIDNLDRIDSEKAFFLIKCIDSIIKFKKTINILLYDEDIIDEILDQKFNNGKKYMNKLVQLKIDVPEVDIYTLNNIKEKIANNLLVNNHPFIDFINNEQYEFDNIRELKRYVNSIISSNVYNGSILDSDDDSNLKYIKSVCPKLYYEIWENKIYFITYDRRYDYDIYTLDYEKLNKDTKNFYNELFKNKEYKKYVSILSKMFPSIENYSKNNKPFSEHIDEANYNESVIRCKICNARYFDLYFTREENDFIRLNKDVESLVNSINNKEEFEQVFVDIVNKYNSDELKVFAEILNINLFKISDNKALETILCLYKSENLFKDRILFFELDSYQRFCIVIADLLSKLTDQEFEKFKKAVHKDYKKLHLIYKIKYWVDNNKKKSIKYNFDFDELFNEMCNKILDDNIDIYSNEYYSRGNIWAIYHFDKDKVKEYVTKNINSSNIYKFLADVISTSVGSNQYGYRITKENIEALSENADIDNLLKKNTDKSDAKHELINEVYNLYKTGKNDFDSEVYRNDFIEL